MVEAWASGLTWREIMMDCAMDEGDLARLLRRTMDVLAQVGTSGGHFCLFIRDEVLSHPHYSCPNFCYVL